MKGRKSGFVSEHEVVQETKFWNAISNVFISHRYFLNDRHTASRGAICRSCSSNAFAKYRMNYIRKAEASTDEMEVDLTENGAEKHGGCFQSF
jgi:hypothetical protein